MKEKIIILTVLALSFLLGSGTKIIPTTPTIVKAAEAPPAGYAQCVGLALSKYLKDLLTGTRGLPNIKITSPAFNLTNPLEFDIFYAMKSGAGGELFKQTNYGNFFGFAGNTYTIDGVRAYEWWNPTSPDRPNWHNEMVGAYAGTQMIFTEFGDFDTFGDGKGLGTTDRGGIIAHLAEEFATSSQDGSIAAINFFDAMPDYRNPDPAFVGHQLSNAEIAQVVGAGSSAKAGQNPGLFVAGEALPQAVQAAGIPNGWVLEILGGPGDLGAAIRFVEAAYAAGYKPIFRTCVGDSCGFAEPQVYAAFLKDLNDAISQPVWIIGGPNEPATEEWAAPGCAPDKKPFDLAEIDCNATHDPEYHSLRPYPASPCNKAVEPSYYICGQDLVVKDVYEFTDTGNCEALPDGSGRRCYYSVPGVSSEVSLGLENSKFPIMGNTELVPNSTNVDATSSERSKLSFAQRVNEYVSWYLNGIPYRAEEKPEDITQIAIEEHPNSLERIINFAGPLKKLLPRQVQTNERNNEEGRIGSSRHDQIAACGSSNDPEQCYSASSSYLRISDLAYTSENNRAFPYLPFSSTEDRVGEASTGLNYGAPSCTTNPPSDISLLGITCIDFEQENSSRNLYFAHIEEDNELGALLQGTYKPRGMDDAGTAPEQPLKDLIATPFCELIETRSNPGDKLYGELVRPGDTETRPISGTLTYSANFTCDFANPTAEEVAACSEGCLPLTGDDYNGCIAECNHTNSTCMREVYIPFSVDIKTPELKTTWERFVAGSMSIVKRIYPQVGPKTPIEELKDIPGETGASYRSEVIAGNPSMLSSQALAGDPAEQRPGATAKIYFPHIGSVYDYFLKGIQKALRPKGIENKNPGDSVPPPLCTIENANFSSSALLAIITQAARWARIPVELLATVVEKEGCGYFGSKNGLCGLSDAQVIQYSAPGAQYPRNCTLNGDRASGPLQIRNGIFPDWSSAVNIGTNEARTPNNCNIKDTIYAAAWILSAGYPANQLTTRPGYNVANSPEPSSWTLTDMQRALSKWVNGYLDSPTQICTTRPALLPAAACFTESYCVGLERNNSTIRSDCNTKPGGSGVNIPAC